MNSIVGVPHPCFSKLRFVTRPLLRSVCIATVGSFALTASDCSIPGRGLSIHFLRFYRTALVGNVRLLGRGWTLAYEKRLVREGDDILFHDGSGRIHRFTPGANSGEYFALCGLPSILEESRQRIVLRQRHGSQSVFESPERGGRLLAIQDSNRNTIRIRYKQNSMTSRAAERLSTAMRRREWRHADSYWIHRSASE